MGIRDRRHSGAAEEDGLLSCGKATADAEKNERPRTGTLIFWWRRMDSNHRRRSQQIYSLSPLATWVLLRVQF